MTTGLYAKYTLVVSFDLRCSSGIFCIIIASHVFGVGMVVTCIATVVAI